MKILAVGDVHIGVGQNLRRATWLGRLIKDTNPDKVIYIGDLLTLDCFSAWDKDKRRKMEGRRYEKEMECGRRFLELVDKETGRHKFETILTEGNHEDREQRYLDHYPELEGAIDYQKQLGLDKREWKIIPYKQFYKLKGVGYTHVPIMENGRAVSGTYCTTRALQCCAHSVVFGHTHKLDYKAEHRHGATHLQECLNIGCFFEHIDEYAVGSKTSYWRGLVEIDHYSNGRFKFQTYPMGLLRREYGSSK